MNAKKFFAAALVQLSLVVPVSWPQAAAIIPRSDTPIIIPRLNEPITFDGLSDEAAWRNIRSLPMVMMQPDFGFPPSEKTEVLIGFDDEFLWVAGRLYDREPDRIQAPSKKRDYMEANTDWFGVIFDTFNDKENGLGFFTTPSGLRWDGAVFNDAKPTMPMDEPINLSWNTFWDVKVAVNGEGWFVEMRIPFSSLRFQDQNGQVVMGLLVWRWIARKNEQIVFPAIYPKWGMMSGWKPSQAQEIRLDGVHSGHPLYITPYALGGGGFSYDLNHAETEYVRTKNPTAEVGLDLKYGLTSNLTFDLTLNPDFAQVEADDQQVNLTRFSLFFPEKRLFFQERAAVFDFNFGGPNRLFYTRRIGLYESEDEDEDARVVPIYGGVRLIGRAGPWDLGVLNMQTAPLAAVNLPSENFGVLRARRRVFNPYSYIGGMITSRIGRDGTYNEAYGLDGTFRLSEDGYLSFGWAQTFVSGKPNNPVSLDPTRLRLSFEQRTRKGLGGSVSFSRAGRDYEPGIGFEMREDFSASRGRVLYGWIPGEKSPLQSHSISAEGLIVVRNEDSTVESAELGPGWEFNFKSGWGGEVGYAFYRESVREEFSFADEADVPPGEYSFSGFRGFLRTPPGKLLSTMFMMDLGTFYDGRRTTLRLMPSWSLLPDLSLGGLYEYNRLIFPGRAQDFTAHLVQLRFLATLSTKFSVLAFIQYNGGDDIAIANLRLRYNPREGNDLYIVYNEGLNTDRFKDIPVRPLQDNRALLVKYSYTFNF
jgi:hypothetical protein